MFGTYLDEVLMMRNAAGTKYYYHANHLYSVHAITNQSGAIVEAVGSYDAYGQPTILTGAGTDATWFTGDDVVGSVSAIGNPWFYTGQRLDAETGLFYYKNRYFDTGLGRFVGRDPIGYRGGRNLYEYVYTQPTSWTDSLGKQGDGEVEVPEDPKPEPPRHDPSGFNIADDDAYYRKLAEWKKRQKLRQQIRDKEKALRDLILSLTDYSLEHTNCLGYACHGPCTFLS